MLYLIKIIIFGLWQKLNEDEEMKNAIWLTRNNLPVKIIDEVKRYGDDCYLMCKSDPKYVFYSKKEEVLLLDPKGILSC
jgi:hypothetical protein